MLRRFQSKITSCLITFYHLWSFALSPANSDLFWFHLKVGKRVNCNKIQPEFKAFSQARLVFPRCAHNFLHVKNAKERERIDKNQTEFKAFSQAREIVSQVHFTRCPHTRECMQRYTNISLLAKTENSSHNWE